MSPSPAAGPCTEGAGWSFAGTSEPRPGCGAEAAATPAQTASAQTTPAQLTPAQGPPSACAAPQRASGQASAAAAVGERLRIRTGADGSFSLWSEDFCEGFHSGRGALREARETFLHPSELERFPPGSTIRVLEVCVGTGCNLAVLLEACDRRGLNLEWIGLEIDPEPLRLALGQEAFRGTWQSGTLQLLEQLSRSPGGGGGEQEPAAARGGRGGQGQGQRQILWGDARRTLRQLRGGDTPGFDLIWHDAFSPQRCPQLWTLEFLTDLTTWLRPGGRWISYCSAAAVREALRLADLRLAALQGAIDPADHQRSWSGGTVAGRTSLPPSMLWRGLTPMELEHMASSAGEPYRDPTGTACSQQILAMRRQAQAEALARGRRGSSSAWRKRWGVER